MKTGKFLTTFPFDDTDIYKTIEGASYSLSVHPDPELDKYVDSLINIVAKAQEPDGYLYTARTIDPKHPHDWSGKERWEQESVLSHELYNSGHLFEAAVAHFMATGKRNFLNIALKNADLLVNVFGPGKRADAPGHEIVEMGLVRLYRITNERKYLDLAKFFIDCRGKEINPRRSYFQDQAPVIQQDEAVGHAVRAGYLYSYINPTTETMVVKIKGKNAENKTENGYAVIDREWKKGDEIEYILPLNIHRVETNSNVEANRNKVALERGPIVYCMEGVDNNNMFGNMILPDDTKLTANFDKSRLNGVGVIIGDGITFKSSSDGLSVQSRIQQFIAIAYYSWCNRGITQMQVWLPRKGSHVKIE